MEQTKYISAKKYGLRLRPPITGRRVNTLCNQNRIKGAIQLSGKNSAWLIPVNTLDPRKTNYNLKQ